MAAAIAIATGLVAWRVFALRAPASSDDAFIAFRYAQNLVAGRGVTFVPTEHVWGYTSPLHVLVLAAIGAIGGDIPVAAIVLGLLATAWSAWLAYRLAARVVDPRAAVVVGIVVLGSHTTFQYLALETPLVGALAWSFVALACADKPRAVLVGVVGALCCLARPDAAVLVVPVLVATPSLRRAWQLWLAFAAIGAAWIAWSGMYYGDVLPNSLRAKFAGAPRGDYVAWILGQYARWATEPVERTGFAIAPLAVNIAAVLAAAGAAMIVWRTPKIRALRPLAIALGAYPAAMLVAYIVMRPAIGHDWEYWNALVFELVAIGVAIASAVGERVLANAWVARAVAAVALVTCALGIRGKLAVIDASDTAYWDGARFAAYTDVARFVHARAPGASLFAGEPGILAFALDDASVYDGFLVTRQPAVAPDYLLLQGDVPAGDSFGAHYTRVQLWPGKTTGFADLSLLAKVAR